MIPESNFQHKDGLRDKEQNFSKLTEIYNDLIILHDLNGDIMEVNENTVLELGYSEAELTSLNIRDLQPQTKRDSDSSPVALNIYTDAKVDITRTVFVRKDGSRFPADVKTSYMRFKQDNDYITVVQRVFRHLDASKKVAEYAKSRKSGDASAMSNRSDFFSLLSQELMGPLNELMGAVKLLNETNVDAEQNQLLSITEKSGHYLLDTITDILDYFKLTAGQLKVTRHSYNLIQSIGDVVELMTPLAEDKGLEFSSFIDSKIPEFIKGDAERVKQVLVKLVANAIKMTNHGTVKIEVNATTDGRVRFEVLDSGGGIEESEQQTLFSEDFYGESSISKQYADVALGYGLAKKLVEKLGGNIGFSSMANEGTLFWFSIDAASEGKKISSAAKYDFLKNQKIIFIDFKETSRNHLERQLRDWGADLQILSDEHISIDRFMTQEIDHINPSLIIFNVHRSNSGHAALVREVNSFLQRYDAIAECNFVVITPSQFLPETARNFARVKHTHVPHPLRIGAFGNKLARLLCLTEPFEVDSFDEQIDVNSKTERDVFGTIMIVDSREVTCLATASILRKEGFTVDCAYSGLDAVNMSQEGNYDAILMDLILQDVDGTDAAQMIRDREAGRHHTPILAVTTNMEDEMWRSCMKVGMDDYITKPLDTEVVIKTIEYWMGSNEVHDPHNIGKSRESESAKKLEKISKHDSLLRFKAGSAVNIAVIRQLIEDTSSEVTAEMLDLFLTETEERIERLKGFSESHSFEQIADEAHTLVSSSGTFGANWLERLASSLEENAKKACDDECEELIQDLPLLYRESRKALLEFRQSNWSV